MSENKNKIDSVILAGGFGTRLSPLTETIPKPLLPINGESALLRNLKILRENGFETTAITTMYLADMVEQTQFPQGEIYYFRENSPLGSAGAVAQFRDDTDDCILILSGDALCDYDLKQLKTDFLNSECQAGIVLAQCEDYGEYGSVCVHNGIITDFCEKPSARDTLSDLVNTGIYFIKKQGLDLIPKNSFFDFAKDLFPKMMKSGMKIAGLQPDGNWFDIGSFSEYHRCNMHYSKGENCVGKQTSIHPDARIEHTVIFDKCTIGNSVLNGCIIGENTTIGNGCIIPNGCVIGNSVELRDGVVLAPMTVVNPKETITNQNQNQFFPKAKQKLIFDDDFIIASKDDDGYFVRLGRLLGGEGKVIAFAQGNGMTLQQACELSCGAAEAGSSCTVIAGGNSALASFSAMEFESRCAYISVSGDKTQIRLFSPDGMAFSREELRKLSTKTPAMSKISGSVYLLPHGVLLKRYLAYLKTMITPPRKINISPSPQNKLLSECAEEFGIKQDESAIKFSLSPDGERAKAVTKEGKEISYWQMLILCCIESGEDEIYLPKDTPDTVERILKRHSITVKFYGDNESDERRNASHHRLHRDGVLLALTSLSIAEEKGKSLWELVSEFPPFSVTVRAVYADRSRMYSVIARLHEESGGRNASFEFGEGRVNIYPTASGRFRLMAEAVDFETAEEISLKAIDLLEKRK